MLAVYGLIIWMVTDLTDECGISTHIEVGERARHFTNIESDGVNYKDLIEKHPDAFQAGSPYPDAYYPDICYDGNYHAVSEDTHWTPFLKAAIDYIRETYPKPWDEATEKLVVFVLGVVAHQVADVSWHALGISQGFLRTMGKVNYHGSFSAAHGDGDFGGDVLNWYELDMDYVGTTDKWYVPTQDLLNIYRQYYSSPDRMPLEVIENCTNLLYLGRLGESIGVIDLLYPDYAEASPFLLDRLSDYYLGGLDDMAVWSENIWKHAVTMIDHGTDVCDLPRNPLYITCSSADDNRLPFTPANQPKREAYEVNPGVDSARILDILVTLVDPADVVIERTERGVYYSYTGNSGARGDRNQEKITTSGARRSDVELPPTVYSTNLHYSRLGEALLSGDVNNDGYDDLVIGAPSYGVTGNYQQGRAYVIYGGANGLPTANLTVEDDANVIIEGSRLNGRFGASIALLDLNQDGQKDLVVSAPSSGSESLDYQGEVYVYLQHSRSVFSSQPSFRISCTERYCNLGWSLSTGDLNNDGHDDLVVGAPFAPAGGEQRGFVGVLYSKAGGFTDMTDEDFDWRWNGEQDYEWLGFSTTVATSPDHNRPMLFVGAPTYRLCVRPDCGYDQGDTESVGKLYTFDSPLPDSPSLTVVGSVRFAQMGYHIHGGQLSGRDVIAMTSVSATADVFSQSGIAAIYASFNDIQPSTTFVGDREFGRFGANAMLADVLGSQQHDVIVTAPFRSETIEERREEGRVFIFDGDVRAPFRDAGEAEKKLGLGEDKARFGTRLVNHVQDNSVQLVISAPHSNVRARLAGRVAVFPMRP